MESNEHTTDENKALQESTTEAASEVAVEEPIAEVSEAPETAEAPEAEVAEEPAAEVVEAPEAEVAEEPPAEVVEAPEAEVAEEPAAEVVETPEAEVAEEPAAEVVETPEAEVAEEPAAEVVEAPEAEVAEEPATEVVETPEAEVAEEPETEAPAEAFADPDGEEAGTDVEESDSDNASFPELKEQTVQPLGVVDTPESEAGSDDSAAAMTSPSVETLPPGKAREVDEAEEKKKPKVPRQKRKRWYIIHTYSGHENKVKVNLERRIESMNMGHKIFRVEVPQKTVTKIKDGKRQEKDERLFPGYVLVEMLMDDDSWYVVRHTPGVTKFVGSEKKPVPAKDSEIKRILFRSAPTTEKVEIDLKVGENIRIISGPFAEFEGTVTEVHPEKGKIKASVSIFGRDTPVELVFNQVQKL